MKTLVGMFPSATEAHAVVRELIDVGVPRDQISVISRDESAGRTEAAGKEMPAGRAAAGAGAGAAIGGLGGLLLGLGALAIPGIGPIIAAGPLAAALGGAALGAAAGGVIGALTDAGVPEEEARYYEEGIRQGRTLVTAHVDEAIVDPARVIMDRHGALEPSQMQATSGERQAQRETQGRTIPVVEEQLEVGKREVQKGAVRVYSTVQQRPIEEQVRLREERVNVERRPADRPVRPGEAAFREDSVEVTETREEPVVAKRARVLEEVVISKESGERTETVRDTVRKTDVRVERPGGAGPTSYGSLESDFRQHCARTLGSQGLGYDECSPAYRFGHSLATHDTYRGGDWSSIEPDARRHWEQRNQGTWDRFKDTIRYAWDRSRGEARAA
jgi:uncharacterized protein (TIGR02271 family)